MKTDKVYIELMLDSIRTIGFFTKGFSIKKFSQDMKTQSAVIMQLALIGESSKKISPKKKKQINLPWKEIAGFRDKAIHDYFSMDLNIVFDTIKTDLPILKIELQKFLKN